MIKILIPLWYIVKFRFYRRFFPEWREKQAQQFSAAYDALTELPGDEFRRLQLRLYVEEFLLKKK